MTSLCLSKVTDAVRSLDNAITATVRLREDNHIPCISGCAFLPDGQLVLCDFANKKIKLMNSLLMLTGSLQLDSSPWDAAVIDQNNVIITVPNKLQLIVIEVKPVLKPVRAIQMSMKCRGVDVAKDRVYVSCYKYTDQGEIRILDFNGNLKRRLGANQDGSFMFRLPCYVVVNSEVSRIYVTDLKAASITSLSLDGRTFNKCNYENVDRLMGIYVDGQDNQFVCGDKNYNIISNSKDSKCGDSFCFDALTFQNSTNGLYSIAYRHSDDTLVLGYMQDDIIVVKKPTQNQI